MQTRTADSQACASAPASSAVETPPVGITIERLVAFYETISPDSLESIDTFYAVDATFRDPFNHVRGVKAIRRIFEHMFLTVDEPQFRVHDTIGQGDQAFIAWTFRFRRSGEKQAWLTIEGSSHVRFDTSGKVTQHRDYWDAAEELYEKFPVLGPLLRMLKRRLQAH